MTLHADQKDIVDKIAKFGFTAIHVTDETGETPPYTYSIGFRESLGCPDFIILGLGGETMQAMLWRLFRQIASGAQIGEGARFVGVIDGADCIARRVHASHAEDYLSWSLWYEEYRGRIADYGAYQLTWPGKADGLYPWDGGNSVKDRQPDLSVPAATTPGS